LFSLDRGVCSLLLPNKGSRSILFKIKDSIWSIHNAHAHFFVIVTYIKQTLQIRHSFFKHSTKKNSIFLLFELTI
jgi:hypothetical protein